MNGDLASYLLGFSEDQNRYVSKKEGGTFKDRWFVEAFKIFVISQNLLSYSHTMNIKREVIKRVFTSSREDKNEVVYELGLQPYLLFDFNNEVHGYNRSKDESIIQYVKRVMACDRIFKSKDYSLAEFCPVNMKDINSKLKLCDHTYYFTLSGGVRNRHRMKGREVLIEPERSSDLATGYNMNIHQHMKYTERAKRMPAKDPIGLSYTNRFLINLKIICDALAIHDKTYYENALHLKPPADFLNNAVNPDMNNLLALDFCNKDITGNSDMVLSKWT